MVLAAGVQGFLGSINKDACIRETHPAKHARKRLSVHAAVESAPERVQGEKEPELKSTELNRFSKNITQPKKQGGSQAMLYATGLKDEDMQKAQVDRLIQQVPSFAKPPFAGFPGSMHLDS